MNSRSLKGTRPSDAYARGNNCVSHTYRVRIVDTHTHTDQRAQEDTGRHD